MIILDQLVQFLIDCAKGQLSLKTAPKAKAARAFFRLYCTMKDCHEEWIRLKQLKIEDRHYSDYVTYIKSIDDLSHAFAKVNDHLRIFDPDAYKAIRSYRGGEYVAIEQINQTLDQALDQGVLAPRFQNLIETDESITIGGIQFKREELAKSMEDNSSFEKASKLLSKFIKKNFNLEDLF